MDKPNQLVFIVGRGRSGTSLLCSVLNAHKSISVVPEGMFLINLYGKYHHVRNWNTRIIDRFCKDLFLEDRLVNWWKLTPEKIRKKISNCEGSLSFGKLCELVYAAEAENQKGYIPPLIIDKNTTNSLFIPMISSVFTNAKFIHIVRDPRDNVASFKNVSFDTGNTIALAERWKYYNREILKQAELRPDQFHRILFEDLLCQPEKSLRNICCFLNVEYHPSLLDFYKKNDYSQALGNATSSVKEAYRNIDHPLDESQAFKWRRKAENSDVAIVDAICKSEMQCFSYEQGSHFTSKFFLIPGIIYGKILNASEKLLFYFPLNIRSMILYFYRRLTKTM